MQDTLRQPLTSGASSLARWARLGAALPGLAAIGFAVQAGSRGSTAGLALGLTTGVVLLVPALLAPFASSEPASDLIFEPAGLRVVGGPHHGLALRWEELDPGGVELVEAREKRVTVALMLAHLLFLVASTFLADRPEAAPYDGDLTARLHLRTRDGRRFLLARGVEDDELESLRALHEALLGRIEPPAGDDAPPTAVRCPACAAPARPADQPTVRCAFCAEPVPMPDALRRRLTDHRALAAERRAAEALCTRLTRLPSARRATFVSRAAFLVVALVSLIAGALFALLIAADAADTFALGLLAFASGALVLFAWRFAARLVIDRRALGAVGALFGARAPSREGEGWGCRSCGAPLPAGEALVLRCAYCDTESVPGLDARRRLSPARLQHRVLEEEARRHTRRRTSATRAAWLLGLFAALSALALAAMGSVSADLLAARRACDHGEGHACYRAALSYFNGTARADRPHALTLAERGCKLHDLDGCCFVRDFARFKWGKPRDLAGAERELAAARKKGKSPCGE